MKIVHIGTANIELFSGEILSNDDCVINILLSFLPLSFITKKRRYCCEKQENDKNKKKTCIIMKLYIRNTIVEI